MELQFPDTSARGLAAAIEAAIRDGVLACGHPLPSVRELAAVAGVSSATAAAALSDLRRRGLIVTKERRRSFVSRRPPVAVAAAKVAVPAGVRDLANGHPDPALLPDLRPVLARLEPSWRSYDDAPVRPELIELARTDFAESGVRAESVCLASGALDAVERVLNAHLAAGDLVAVEDPCYTSTLDLVRAMGLRPIPVAIDGCGLLTQRLAEAIAAGAQALLLTPRAQNPTGAALDRARALELEQLLGRHPDLLVIEDDHQGPIAGAPGYSVAAKCQRWARVRSMAKPLGPDIRLAFITGDESTVSRLEGRFTVGPGWVSEILQRLVVELLSDKSVASGLARASRVYRERRAALLEALRRHRVAATGRSGFNVWIPVAEEARVVAALLESGWAVAPGEPFRIEAGPAIRVTTATLPPSEAEGFAADLAAVLAPARRRRAA